MIRCINNAAHEFGTYAKLVPSADTQQKIVDIINRINIENPIGPKSLHVTVVYSREQCEAITDILVPLPIEAYGTGFDIFKNNDGSNCLVLKIDSVELHALHHKCRSDYGATHDFPQYHPHITLSYDYPSRVVPNQDIVGYFDHLVFDQYVVEPLIF